MVWIAIARTPGNGPRPKATTKISANTMSGTVRQNSRRRRVTNTVVALPVRFGEARKFSAEGEDRARQRADIGHQDRLADETQRALEAPEPSGRIGPNPRARVERRQAVEIAEESADLGEESLRIDLRLDHRQADQRGEDRGRDEELHALRPRRAAIGGEDGGELAIGQTDDGAGHVRGRSTEDGGRRTDGRPSSALCPPFSDHDLFLRSVSTNFTSSIVLL